jgi:mannose-6-phosphate isomerase-like protein (cupin superfamily)
MFESYVARLKKETKHNHYFRKVLFTGGHSQLVMMCLQAGEEIGAEVHEVDQLIFVVEGEGQLVIDGRREKFEDGMVACVPAGLEHNVVNTSDDEPLQLFTVYAPAQHAPGAVEKTRAVVVGTATV